MVRFNILRCDEGAAHLLGWAKTQAQRLIEAGIDNFTRTWPVGDLTVRARAVEFMGDVVVKLSLEAGVVIRNRLMWRYAITDAFNFSLVPAPETEEALAAIRWSDRITAVNLTALDFAARFQTAQGIEGRVSKFGLRDFPKARLFATLRAYVLAGHRGARYWLNLLPTLCNIRVRGRLLTVTEVTVSQPDSGGEFQILMGMWEPQRESDGTFSPADPDRPRTETFVGVSASITDMERVAFDGVSIDFDTPVLLANGNPDPTYRGARFFGKYWDGSEVVEAGEVYEREELGSFPASQSGSLVYRNYRPAGDASPFGYAMFSRRGEISGADTTVTYDFKLHRLSAAGTPEVTDVALPAGTPTTTTEYTFGPTGFDILAENNGWTDMPQVFFDGEQFVRVGQNSQTASRLGSGAYEGADLEGVRTLIGALPQIDDVPGDTSPWSVDFDTYVPGHEFAYTRDIEGADPRIVFETEFEDGPYSLVIDNQFPPFPAPGSVLAGARNMGPVWGTYSNPGATYTFAESGFAVVGFTGSESAGTGQVPNKAHVLPTAGAYWYRANEPIGVFIFAVPADQAAFAADCEKYRHIFYRDEGYRRVRDIDGTFHDEAGYEDPEVVLQRIWDRVRIDANNFGTPAMVPWLPLRREYVIV